MKICGIRDVATAVQVATLAPSAIGLNFYKKTPRLVSEDIAKSIVEKIPELIEPVGLFVNHSVSSIIEICARCRIEIVQIHGDESAEFLADLQSNASNLKILRAFRVGDEGLEPVGRYLEECRQMNVSIAACLVDSRVEEAYGGSGKTAPWEVIRDEYQSEWPRLILAGGLNPENIADAIRTVHPWGVDVASGVESSSTVKDFKKVEAFLCSAKNAFDEIGQSRQSNI